MGRDCVQKISRMKLVLENRLVMETRLLSEQMTWTHSFYWRHATSIETLLVLRYVGPRSKVAQFLMRKLAGFFQSFSELRHYKLQSALAHRELSGLPVCRVFLFCNCC